jgi:hypothetical protein
MDTLSVTPLDSKKTTLADIEVAWKDRHGFEHTVRGETLVMLLLEAEHQGRLRAPLAEDDHSCVAPMLLQGLGAIMFPDAGEPVADIDKSRRYFLSEALDWLAARQYAENVRPGLAPESVAVRVLRSNGARPHASTRPQTHWPNPGDEA